MCFCKFSLQFRKTSFANPPQVQDLQRYRIHAASSLAPLWAGGGGCCLHCRLRGVLPPASAEAEPQQTREPGDALLCTLIDGVDQRLLRQVRLLRGALLLLLFTGSLLFIAAAAKREFRFNLSLESDKKLEK